MTYIKSAPPRKDSKNKVFSLILRLCFLAFILSATQTNTDIVLITISHIRIGELNIIYHDNKLIDEV